MVHFLPHMWSLFCTNEFDSKEEASIVGVDAKAQTHIVTHKYFVPSINKSKSIHSIGDIFSKSACTNMTKKMEPSSDAHH